MARKTQRAALSLSTDQRNKLEQISKSRKAPLREVQRAQVLLHYADGIPISQVQELVKVSRPSIYKCIDKALAAGPDAGLKDYYHRPFDPTITDEAKAWVVNLACTKPKDHGLAAELWTLSELAKFTRKNAPEAGLDCLAKAAKASIWRILTADAVKPHKIAYYLERRDPEFEQKMQEVLMVYQEVNLQNDQKEKTLPSVITVSVDEKPGVQAIQNIAPDLPPEPGKYKTIGRDYEYKRLGTVSIIAALDLHDGKIMAQVHDRHRSREFIELLKELDEHYRPDCTVFLNGTPRLKVVVDRVSKTLVENLFRSHLGEEAENVWFRCVKRYVGHKSIVLTTKLLPKSAIIAVDRELKERVQVKIVKSLPGE